MIRAEEIKDKIEAAEYRKELAAQEHNERLSNSIFKVVETEITKQLEISKIKSKYYFSIPLIRIIPNPHGDLCHWDDTKKVAWTRDNKILCHSAKLLESHLRLHGWKNIEIKVCNNWCPIIPKIKIWMEVGE